MSAFVVNKATMDRVVSDWCSDQYHPGSRFDAKQLDDVGRKLFRLNCAAVNARYRDEPGMDPLCRTYKFSRYDCPWTAMQRLKAMKCLLYQCSEGKVPETPLYKELEARIASRMDEIISELPEYKAAGWNASGEKDPVSEDKCPACNAPAGAVPAYCHEHDVDYSRWLVMNNID